MNYNRIYQETYDALDNMYNTGMEIREGQENLMLNVCQAFKKTKMLLWKHKWGSVNHLVI